MQHLVKDFYQVNQEYLDKYHVILFQPRKKKIFFLNFFIEKKNQPVNDIFLLMQFSDFPIYFLLYFQY